MKFKKIGPNRVRSDSGFEFWMKTPFDLYYFENKRVARIPGEMLTGNTELLVSTSVIKAWMHPFAQEIICEEKREQIKLNISEALSFLGITHEFN